jgi:hypothetical protein
MIALRFTKCFYNISGLINAFAVDASEDDQIAKMSSQTYQIYTMFKHHWRNICHFVKQLVFSEETAKSIIDLLHSMIASTVAIHELREEVNRTTAQLNATILKVRNQVDNTTNYVDFLFISFGSLGVHLNIVREFLDLALFLVDNLKYYFALLIVLAVFGIFVPKIIGPVIFVSIVVFASDRALASIYGWWIESKLRAVSRFQKQRYFERILPSATKRTFTLENSGK